MRLEYRHLDLLVAIAEAGSLTAAAVTLGTNQPHVSRQLRRIEEHLGIPVFERTAEGVRPTAAGALVLDQVRKALSVAQQVDSGPTGGTVLRILHSRILASSFLRQLRIEHPDVVPELGFATAADAFARLASGGADVYIGVQLPHVAWPQVADLVVQRVVSDPLRVLLPSSHRLAACEMLELGALSQDDWITTAMPDARDMAIGECRAVGRFEPRLRYEVDDSGHLRMLIRDGLGVSFASSAWPPSIGVMAPYLGASAGQWSVVSAPGRVDAAVMATLAELVGRRFASLTEDTV